MTTDFLRDPDTGDLVIRNGDLVVGDSTLQHQQDLVLSDKGWYHHAPVRGVGVQNYLNDLTAASGLSRAIHAELSADGQTVNSVKITNGQIQITAAYV